MFFILSFIKFHFTCWVICWTEVGSLREVCWTSSKILSRSFLNIMIGIQWESGILERFYWEILERFYCSCFKYWSFSNKVFLKMGSLKKKKKKVTYPTPPPRSVLSRFSAFYPRLWAICLGGRGLITAAREMISLMSNFSSEIFVSRTKD